MVPKLFVFSKIFCFCILSRRSFYASLFSLRHTEKVTQENENSLPLIFHSFFYSNMNITQSFIRYFLSFFKHIKTEAFIPIVSPLVAQIPRESHMARAKRLRRSLKIHVKLMLLNGDNQKTNKFIQVQQ